MAARDAEAAKNDTFFPVPARKYARDPERGKKVLLDQGREGTTRSLAFTVQRFPARSNFSSMPL